MCYSKYCGGGDKGGGWELQLLVCLWCLRIQGRATGAESPGAPAPSPWVAIYRLLNMFRVAGRRDALSLPTSVHVERDGFSPP